MHSIERLVLLGSLLCLGACARQTPPAAAVPPAPTLCARQPLTHDELSGILAGPLVADQAVPGDPQSCRYSTAGFPGITVSARAGAGRATLDAWRQGRVPLAVTPVAGLGGGAFWQEGLHELIAEDHDLLCDVQVAGAAADLAVSAAALPERLAQVCRALFSRL